MRKQIFHFSFFFIDLSLSKRERAKAITLFAFHLITLWALGGLSLHAQEYRDVVFLKNGSVIKGFYKELYPSGSLRMETIDGGLFICPMSDVVRIAKEKTEMYVVKIDTDKEPVKWRPRGYVGSLEYGLSVNIDDSHIFHSSIFTTHGYAFNRNLVLGAGIGFEQIRYIQQDVTVFVNQFNMPIYADIKCNLLHSRTTPYIDVRAGYNVIGYRGVYFNPSVGVDFSFTPRAGAFFAVGYVLQRYKEDDTRLNSKNISFRLGLHF